MEFLTRLKHNLFQKEKTHNGLLGIILFNNVSNHLLVDMRLILLLSNIMSFLTERIYFPCPAIFNKSSKGFTCYKQNLNYYWIHCIVIAIDF